MELKWLEDFQSLAKQGNFSAAAKERNVTQPAFSRRIQALEFWLGVTLFDRTSYPITLTEHGEKFEPAAEELIHKIRNLKYDFSQLSVQSEQNIRITSMHTLAIHYLPMLTRKIGPDIKKFNLIVNPSVQGIDNHFAAILDENTDILITFFSEVMTPPTQVVEKLEIIDIGREKFIPVLSSELYYQLKLDQLSPAETEVPYLSYSEFTFIDKILKPTIESSQWRLLRVYESSLSEGIRSMVMQGMGLAWLPRTLIQEQLNNQTLIQVGPSNAEIDVEIHGYRLKECRRSAVLEFWSAMQVATGYPWPT